MGRYLALDVGRKRIGIAASDPAKIIAQGVTTVHSKDIWTFLDDYLNRQDVELFVVGYPIQLNGNPSESLRWVNPFIRKLKKKYPEMEIVLEDERFTSGMARQAMIDGGMKKKDRQNKENADRISAVLILQSYMMKTENKI